MSYLKASEVDTLTLPSDSAYFVKMRRRIKWGAISKAQSAMLKVDVGSAQLTDVEMGAGMNYLIAGAVVEWNLTDANEQVLPITPESIDELEPEDGQFLMLEASKRMAVRKPEAEAPFASPS